MERLGLRNTQLCIMNITLNGKEHALKGATSVTELLHSLGLADKPVVVELNKEALFPREYSKKELADKDSVEIISISAGG